MSFDEKYSKAKEIIREARKKLLRYILLNPVRDADAMRHFYYDFAKLCERFEGQFNITEYGNVKFAYYGKPVPGKRFRYQFAYSGPEMTYTDTGHPLGPQYYYLPSVPVIQWDMKLPEDVLRELNPEALRRCVAIVSDTYLTNDQGYSVSPDFEDATWKYYFPDTIYPAYPNISYELDEWHFPEQKLWLGPFGYAKVGKVEGPGFEVAWKQIRNRPFGLLITNVAMTIEFHPPPGWGESSYAELKTEGGQHGNLCFIACFKETLDIILFTKHVRADVSHISGSTYKIPVFVIGVEEYHVQGIKKVGYIHASLG